VGQHTDMRTGRVMPLIELTRSDLEHGLKRYPVTSSSPVGTEALASVAAPPNKDLLGVGPIGGGNVSGNVGGNIGGNVLGISDDAHLSGPSGGQTAGRATLTLTPEPPTSAGPSDPGLPVQSYLVTTPLIPDWSLVSLTLRFDEGLHNRLPDHIAAALAEEFEGWAREPMPSGTALLDRLVTVGSDVSQPLRAAIIEALDERAAVLQFSDPRSFRLVDLEKLATGLVAFAKLPRRDLVVGVVRVAGCPIFLSVVLGLGTGLQVSTHHAVTEISNVMVDRVAQRLRAEDSPPR
jgi:hypothetical protein